MKYSIIIPVFNVEKYLDRCIDSILKQTYQNYELIFINDASTDLSLNILKDYEKKYSQKIKIYSFDKNKGQSVARNFGVEKAKGEYIFFIDADDYIDLNLLEKINDSICKNSDIQLLRIPKRIIEYKSGNILNQDNIETFNDLDGRKAFVKIRRNRITLETPWSYIINKDYWTSNEFKFCEGRILEDFGLMPFVIFKANNVSSIKDPFYNYVIRNNSTMNRTEYADIQRKSKDVLYHYDYLYDKVQKFYKKNDIAKKEYIQYISDAVFSYFKKLHYKDLKEYYKEVKKRNIYKRMKIYSFKSLVKKIIYTYYICNLIYKRKD